VIYNKTEKCFFYILLMKGLYYFWSLKLINIAFHVVRLSCYMLPLERAMVGAGPKHVQL